MWEYIAQSGCWPFVKDFRHLKGQAEFPLNWVGWKKERKEETNKWPGTMVVNWGREEDLALRKPPLQWGNQRGQKITFGGSKESSVDSLWKTGQNKTVYMWKCTLDWDSNPRGQDSNLAKTLPGTWTQVAGTWTWPKPMVFHPWTQTWFQDLMKLRFSMFHCRKNSVRDKWISKKWLIQRETLHRQNVGHCRGWVRPQYVAQLAYGEGNFIGSIAKAKDKRIYPSECRVPKNSKER